MLKMKNILPVFVMLLFLGVANTAFAQLSCSLASTPVSRATDTGLTEPAGDITFNCAQTSATNNSQATITVDYGTPITSINGTPTVSGYPLAKPISVVSNTCAVAIPSTSPVAGSPGITVSYATGQVVMTVPAVLGLGAGTTCSFTLQGVLLALAGTGKLNVVANVSVSPGNNLSITAGQNTPTVVTSVLPGIIATGFTRTAGPGQVLTSGAPVTLGSPTFTISVTENYIDMYRAVTQFNSGASTQGVQLLFTFSGIPTGVTVGGCVGGVTGTGATATATLSAATITSTANTLLLEVTGTANLSAVEAVTVTCTTFTAGSSATLPLAAGSISATVTLAPTGVALVSGVPPVSATAGQIPRYTANVLGPLTVLNIISATTHMLFPFVSVGNGFDTGFAIANTSTDPYGFTSGAVNTAGGARSISGPITLAFYPSGGTPFCVSTGAGAATVNGITSCTTLAATGSGLGLTSGALNSGNSWVVLASELFKQVSGAPAVFNGYVFGISNFPYAHSTVFVADAAFSGKFTAGGPALVLSNPTVLARTGGLITGGAGTLPVGFAVGLVESLGH